MAFFRIGESLVDQPLDHGDHLIDMIGGARLYIRTLIVERRHIGVELIGAARGDGGDILSARARGINDLVIDIGDVPHIGDLRIEPAQQPRQRIEHHHRARITDMGVVIDRRAAHIHADMTFIDRNELFLLPGQRIVDLQRHRIISLRIRR